MTTHTGKECTKRIKPRSGYIGDLTIKGFAKQDDGTVDEATACGASTGLGFSPAGFVFMENTY